MKFRAAQVGVEEVQRLAGARFSYPGTQAMFFAGTTYSARATLFAEDAGIALFSYGLDGRVTAINDLAEDIATQPQIEAVRRAGADERTRIKSQAEEWLEDLLNRTDVLRRLRGAMPWFLAALMLITVGGAALFVLLTGSDNNPGIIQLAFSDDLDRERTAAGRLVLAASVFIGIVGAALVAAWLCARRAVREWKLIEQHN